MATRKSSAQLETSRSHTLSTVVAVSRLAAPRPMASLVQANLLRGQADRLLDLLLALLYCEAPVGTTSAILG
jgi:hypothetical protein